MLSQQIFFYLENQIYCLNNTKYIFRGSLGVWERKIFIGWSCHMTTSSSSNFSLFFHLLLYTFLPVGRLYNIILSFFTFCLIALIKYGLWNIKIREPILCNFSAIFSFRASESVMLYLPRSIQVFSTTRESSHLKQTEWLTNQKQKLCSVPECKYINTIGTWFSLKYSLNDFHLLQ